MPVRCSLKLFIQFFPVSQPRRCAKEPCTFEPVKKILKELSSSLVSSLHPNSVDQSVGYSSDQNSNRKWSTIIGSSPGETRFFCAGYRLRDFSAWAGGVLRRPIFFGLSQQWIFSAPIWCRWPAYLPFTQDTRVRVPVSEMVLQPTYRWCDIVLSGPTAEIWGCWIRGLREAQLAINIDLDTGHGCRGRACCILQQKEN